jgi:hypothetical protein
MTMGPAASPAEPILFQREESTLDAEKDLVASTSAATAGRIGRLGPALAVAASRIRRRRGACTRG